MTVWSTPVRDSARNKLCHISPSKAFEQSCSLGVMLLDSPGFSPDISALLHELLGCGEEWAVLLPPQPAAFAVHFIVLKLVGDWTPPSCVLGCFVISRGSCFTVKEILHLFIYWKDGEGDAISLCFIQSFALQADTLHCTLGCFWCCRVVCRGPGKLQPEKGQPRVKQFWLWKLTVICIFSQVKLWSSDRSFITNLLFQLFVIYSKIHQKVPRSFSSLRKIEDKKSIGESGRLQLAEKVVSNGLQAGSR